MNEDSPNLPDSADLKQIENLIEILIDEKTSPPNFDSESLSEPDFNLSRSAQLAIKDSPQDFNLIKLDSVTQEDIAIEKEQKSEATIKPPDMTTIEEVERIATEKATPEDLADAVNSLIPLIVGLLEFKLDNSRSGIIQTIRPVLDRLIEERTQEDSPKMAAAIARILPAAIEDEIRLNPLAIARAIAPEIALAIREQIRLDKEAIPETLGPEMGKAIKAQIESSKDAMVDALYPVIGTTIAKYMVEVVQDINSK
ncbi:MAG: hypothetical protein RLZZ574_3069, partial [Cyanobacteriota bacterium]